MLKTDASNKVAAGVFSQQDFDLKIWHFIAFFTKTMQTAELNYDIHDKEMLAIIQALDQWRPELQGLQTENPFLIYSDHRALKCFITTKKLSAR